MKWNLEQIACRAMQERDLLCDFSAEALHQAEHLQERLIVPSYRDMTETYWISIDNDDSLDLDQLTYAQGSHFFVAIADVDGLVKMCSPIDKHAFHNTTSVYTDPRRFPMLPSRLSTNLSSLNQDAMRPAVVVQIAMEKNGEFSLLDIFAAWVKNWAKLTYNRVSATVEGHKSGYDSLKIIEQLTLQEQIAKKIKENRERQGALQFETAQEVHPIISDDEVVALQPVVSNRAHQLIENFMIAANVCMSRYMKEKGLSILQRVVKVPKYWDKIVLYAAKFGERLPDHPDNLALQQFLKKQKNERPEQFEEISLAIIKLIGRGEYVTLEPGDQGLGHFDLAQADYAHTTAPNRRFPDLVMQRLLKAHFASFDSPYTDAELHHIAARCTQKEDDAMKVERRVHKSVMAVVLSTQVGKEFSAIVTGASEKGTWVRIQNPPVEGKLVRGFQGCLVGDKIRVKLLRTDVENGFIDFQKS